MSKGQNEAFSRVLIDKALEFSGWDLLDPRQVVFELHGSALPHYGLESEIRRVKQFVAIFKLIRGSIWKLDTALGRPNHQRANAFQKLLAARRISNGMDEIGRASCRETAKI